MLTPRPQLGSYQVSQATVPDPKGLSGYGAKITPPGPHAAEAGLVLHSRSASRGGAAKDKSVSGGGTLPSPENAPQTGKVREVVAGGRRSFKLPSPQKPPGETSQIE